MILNFAQISIARGRAHFWRAVDAETQRISLTTFIDQTPTMASAAAASSASSTAPKIAAALIVGVGDGVSASLTRKLAAEGTRVALASRNTEKLAALCKETGAQAFAADAGSSEDVQRLFKDAVAAVGPLDLVIFNAGPRVRGPIASLNPDDVAKVLQGGAFGGFLVGQAAAQHMLAKPLDSTTSSSSSSSSSSPSPSAPLSRGTILFTGASASIKGFPQSAPFAMAKFALRGLAQSMARELAPQGIHVGHVVIDGAIRSAAYQDPADKPDSTIQPDALADSYLYLLKQPRSAWTWEIEVRPWVEKF